MANRVHSAGTPVQVLNNANILINQSCVRHSVKFSLSIRKTLKRALSVYNKQSSEQQFSPRWCQSRAARLIVYMLMNADEHLWTTWRAMKQQKTAPGPPPVSHEQETDHSWFDVHHMVSVWCKHHESMCDDVIMMMQNIQLKKIKVN